MQHIIIEQALSYLINNSTATIKPLNNKTIHLSLQDLPFDAYFICINNRVFVLSSANKVDVDIKLKTQAFISLFKGQNISQLLRNDEIIINGEVKTAQLLIDLLKQTNFNWEKELSKYTNNEFANKAAQVIKKFDNLEFVKDKLTQILIQPSVVK